MHVVYLDMAEFSSGDRFDVTDDTIELYYEGELTEIEVDYVTIDSIVDNTVTVSHYGDDPRLPLTEKVKVSDVADAIGNWLE